MADINRLEDLIKLGDMPEEQKEMLKDSIIFGVEHESEFGDQVNRIKLDENMNSFTYSRQYLPEVDKKDPRYKNGLTEGVTPKAESMNLSEYTVPVIENGWYIKFTNKAVKHSYHDFLERARKQLKNLFISYEDEKIADTYFTSTNVVTKCDLTSLEDLTNLNNILFKNGAKTFSDGNYRLVVSTEVATKMLIAFKDIITHTTEKEAVIKGEIGKIAGFSVVRSRLQAFATTDGKAKFLAYGKTNNDQLPVSAVGYDNGNAQVIYKNLGELAEGDALNQVGSIGIYVDGHGYCVYDDSVLIRGEVSLTGVKYIAKFDEKNRSNLVGTSSSPTNIYPDLSTITLKAKATHQLVIKDEKGTDIKADCTFASSDTKIATVDSGEKKGLITAVKAGSCKVFINKGEFTTTVNVVVEA